MQTKRLNLFDSAWLSLESPHSPMHVGGLLTFTLPDDAPADFCDRILMAWRGYTRAHSPWNHRLRQGRMARVAPEWELLEEIDVDYHVRRSILPAPGGEVEMGALTSRLHSRPLDLARPPWECHLIEGLADHRFAIYIKMHHALVDGVYGMRLLARALATDPGEIDRPPFWAIVPRKRPLKSPQAARPGLYRAVAQLVGETRDQVSSLPSLAGVVRDMLKAARTEGSANSLPFAAPYSILNGRIDARRRYATQRYSLSEIKALSQSAGVTINDIVLAISGGALRRYLREIGELPARPLTAGIPVSVRPADDDECGSAIAFIIATLATDVEDTRTRLATIAASSRAAKQRLRQLSASAITQYTVALMAPYLLGLVSGMAGRTRPVFNVAVSNVPGPSEPLYIGRARMEAFYPVSLITHGQALNITVHGYADTLGFGFLGCGNTLPSMQRLAAYAGETLDELRALYGGNTAGAAGVASRRRCPA